MLVYILGKSRIRVDDCSDLGRYVIINKIICSVVFHHAEGFLGIQLPVQCEPALMLI